MKRITSRQHRTVFGRLFSRICVVSAASVIGMWPALGSANDFCPDVYFSDTFEMNFNPAFMYIDKFNHGANQYDGLVVTSFFNAIKNPAGTSSVAFFQRDLVARITGLPFRSGAWWNPNQAEILTDLDQPPIIEPLPLEDALPVASGPGQQVWPNEAQRVPDGILPFEAIVSPQGFHPAPEPGRLTLIDLDDPNRQEYIIDQSPQANPPPFIPCRYDDAADFNPANRPRFYHLVKWFDMDEDGFEDAVTVRSGFKVSGTFCLGAIAGEVVWFKNPGAALDPNIEWAEFTIAGVSFGPNPPGEDSRNSSDISLDMADLEGDGVPEIVGGSFFTADLTASANGTQDTDKNITIYGAPAGQNWATVNPTTNPARIAVVSTHTANGESFQVTFEDLNRDGNIDILATNHAPDNCPAFAPFTSDPIPGRVWAMSPPASGDIFNDPWVQHTLKDNIRPNPTHPAPTSGPGRLAPGFAIPFWPTPWDEFANKPWILVGGDEASKVWVLRPQSQNTNDWNYDSATIFDINDHYGPNTTQSFTAPAPATGVSISTIGAPAWRYDRDWAWGAYAEIYIPIFEGRDIHRITFRPLGAAKKVTCPADVQVSCPVP